MVRYEVRVSYATRSGTGTTTISTHRTAEAALRVAEQETKGQPPLASGLPKWFVLEVTTTRKTRVLNRKLHQKGN